MAFEPGNLATKIAKLADAWFYPRPLSYYLEIVSPLWSPHNIRARVEKVTAETDNAVTLTLRPGRGWRSHLAGQHVQIGVTIRGRLFLRTFSIASAPETFARGGGTIAITVKRVPQGLVTTYLTQAVRPGELLTLGQAQGHFTRDIGERRRGLLITGGSGITPVLSLLRQARAVKDVSDLVHVHFDRSEKDVIAAAELADLPHELPNYKQYLIYTEKHPGQESRRVRMSEPLLEALCPDWRLRDVWASGPQGLLDSVETIWKGVGLESRVRIERFRASWVPSAETQRGTVQFAKGAVQVDSDGRTPLLNLAEKAGLNPPHGCRMGICHTCTCALLGGTVRDLRTGQLVAADPGQKIQICVTAAVGDVKLDL